MRHFTVTLSVISFSINCGNTLIQFMHHQLWQYLNSMQYCIINHVPYIPEGGSPVENDLLEYRIIEPDLQSVSIGTSFLLLLLCHILFPSFSRFRFSTASRPRMFRSNLQKTVDIAVVRDVHQSTRLLIAISLFSVSELQFE